MEVTHARKGSADDIVIIPSDDDESSSTTSLKSKQSETNHSQKFHNVVINISSSSDDDNSNNHHCTTTKQNKRPIPNNSPLPPPLLSKSNKRSRRARRVTVSPPQPTVGAVTGQPAADANGASASPTQSDGGGTTSKSMRECKPSLDHAEPLDGDDVDGRLSSIVVDGFGAVSSKCMTRCEPLDLEGLEEEDVDGRLNEERILAHDAVDDDGINSEPVRESKPLLDLEGSLDDVGGHLKEQKCESIPSPTLSSSLAVAEVGIITSKSMKEDKYPIDYLDEDGVDGLQMATGNSLKAEDRVRDGKGNNGSDKDDHNDCSNDDERDVKPPTNQPPPSQAKHPPKTNCSRERTEIILDDSSSESSNDQQSIEVDHSSSESSNNQQFTENPVKPLDVENSREVEVGVYHERDGTIDSGEKDDYHDSSNSKRDMKPPTDQPPSHCSKGRIEIEVDDSSSESSIDQQSIEVDDSTNESSNNQQLNKTPIKTLHSENSRKVEVYRERDGTIDSGEKDDNHYSSNGERDTKQKPSPSHCPKEIIVIEVNDSSSESSNDQQFTNNPKRPLHTENSLKLEIACKLDETGFNKDNNNDSNNNDERDVKPPTNQTPPSKPKHPPLPPQYSKEIIEIRLDDSSSESSNDEQSIDFPKRPLHSGDHVDHSGDSNVSIGFDRSRSRSHLHTSNDNITIGTTTTTTTRRKSQWKRERHGPKVNTMTHENAECQDRESIPKRDRRRDDDDRSLSSGRKCDQSDDESDGIDDHKQKLWLSSPSRNDKINYVQTIEHDIDKALQMLLWDIGFDYKIYAHQFEAIRFVAGVVPTFPSESDRFEDDDDDDDDTRIQHMLKYDRDGEAARLSALHSIVSARNHQERWKLILPTKGCLLADEMGLGKTIEALAGAALRNAMQDARVHVKGGVKYPTLIVAPQDGVMNQWYRTLREAGVESARIQIVGEGKNARNDRGGEDNKKNGVRGGYYILCTRYKIFSEIKRLFNCTSATNMKDGDKKSIFFPQVPFSLIKKLKNQKRAVEGFERSEFKEVKEKYVDCVTRLVKESFRGRSRLNVAFNTVIIDEAHFVKNVLAFWGFGSALLGAQSKRTALLTGTPYNNGPSDMSALMTYIDPRHEAANIGWWEEATAKGSKQAVVEAVSTWRKAFMLRRGKAVLAQSLPPILRKNHNIEVYPSELGIYEAYEAFFLSAIDRLREELEDDSPQAIRSKRELRDLMMACMSNMRQSLIHPVLPGGREVTIQFSPSRRRLLKREEKKERCVFCFEVYPTQTALKFAARKAGNMKEEVEDKEVDQRMVGLNTRVRSEINLDDEDLDDNNDLGTLKDIPDMQKGLLVELSSNICQAHGSGCRHFGHEKCIEVHMENGCPRCPRCFDLSSRINITNATDTKNKVPHRVYCQGIMTSIDSTKGFTASAKIEKAIKWFQMSVPKNEKAIILSFFKGSLDLIEGILTEEYGIDCARYDGDVNKEVRAIDLQRFKTSNTCRVLLASVQSGGCGLNIQEANNICFLDRWFNPCVHDQAESRCHRLGQSKKVKVTYLDTSFTVDIVMKRINALKAGNAAVLLADGTSLGDQWSLTYKNLAGFIGTTMKEIVSMRQDIVWRNIANGDADAPLIYMDYDLETKPHEVMTSKDAEKTQPTKVNMEDSEIRKLD